MVLCQNEDVLLFNGTAVNIQNPMRPLSAAADRVPSVPDTAPVVPPPVLELADLPFAASLRAHVGDVECEGDYDCVHFDRNTFTGVHAAGARFLDCAFTGTRFDEGKLVRARFQDAWLRDVRLVGTEIAESSWQDTAALSTVLAGIQGFNAVFRRVTFQSCKLDSVNFRGAVFTDVVFNDCVLRDVDFSMAKLTRVSFAGSRLTGAGFTKATLDAMDLRGADFEIAAGIESLRGAIIGPDQLVELAPLLAQSIGIRVEER